VFTVALVGGDGAGKTTVAKGLEQVCAAPVKYLYMGLSTQSSNLALPTSRLVRYLRLRSYRTAVTSGTIAADATPSRDLHYGGPERGTLWITVRALNRLAEAWYRQLLSLSYRLRGYVVVYDRHFLFETAPEAGQSEAKKRRRVEAFEHWVIRQFYPRPDLVIFLDAPAQVLYERKGEASPEHLEKRRRAVLRLGRQMPNFVRVDATQPPATVLAEVTQHVEAYCASLNHGKKSICHRAS
jgi:thymidylate kinase